MRVPPMLSVELAGRVEHRPGVLDVLQYDRNGKPTVSRMRPLLEPGEVLQERPGRIPAVIRTEL